MSSKYFQALQSQHEALLQAENDDKDILAEVKAYIEQIQKESQKLASPEERDQLRSILRYWSAFIYEQTEIYPQLQLLPVLPEYEAEYQRTQARRQIISVLSWIVALIFVIGSITAVNFFISQRQVGEQISILATLEGDVLRQQATDVAEVTRLSNALSTLEDEVETRISEAVETRVAFALGPVPTLTLIPTPINPTSTATFIIPTFSPTATPTPTNTPTSTLTETPTASTFGIPNLTVPPSFTPISLLTLTVPDTPTPIPSRTPTPHFTITPISNLTQIDLNRLDRLTSIQKFSYSAKFLDADRTQVDISQIAYGFNQNELIFGGAAGQVALWNFQTNDLSLLAKTNEVLQTIAVNHDNYLVAFAGNQRTIRLIRGEVQPSDSTLPDKLFPEAEFAGHSGFVFSVAFSPDGGLLVSVGGDAAVRLWDITTGIEQNSIRASGTLYEALFSPNGHVIAIANSDEGVSIFDKDSGQILCVYRDIVALSIAFSPNGSQLAVGGENGQLSLLQTDNCSFVQTLDGHTEDVTGLAYHPFEPNLLISASRDTTVRVWNLVEANEAKVLNDHSHPVETIDFSPNGTSFASADSMGNIIVWGVE